MLGALNDFLWSYVLIVVLVAVGLRVMRDIDEPPPAPVEAAPVPAGE